MVLLTFVGKNNNILSAAVSLEGFIFSADLSE